MNGKRIGCILVLGMAWVLCGSAPADAQGPFDQLLNFRRVEADPDKSYGITRDNGPWMIMACSFSGDGAQQQAQELVLELRKRYKLPAYMHRKQFAFGEEQAGGIGWHGNRRKMRFYREGAEELEEVAVLVGNYEGVDDSDAQRTLRKLKYTEPKSLDIKERGSTTQSLAGWRMIQKNVPKESQSAFGALKGGGKSWAEYKWRSVQKEKKLGPMGHAFVVTNPLLPKDFFAPKGLDPMIVTLNKNRKYSLLKCPGKYTVQVATFRGNALIDQEEIQAIKNGQKEMESKLELAEKKAHELATILRAKDWEAYEFHDHNASIVTVGSFDSVGIPQANGTTEIHREIDLIIRTFGVTGDSLNSRQVKVLGRHRIPLDIQPVIVEVPQRSISRELTSRPF